MLNLTIFKDNSVTLSVFLEDSAHYVQLPTNN